MYKWLPFALVRVTFFYIIGILLGVYVGEFISIDQAFYLTLFLSFLSFISFIVLRKERFVRYNLIFSVLTFITITSFGFYNLKLNDDSLKTNHLSKFNNISAFTAMVDDIGYETDKTYRYLLKAYSVNDDHWQDATGNLYLYLSKDSETQLSYGDVILIKGKPNDLSGPMNPGEFDYKQFLSFKNIDFQYYSTGDNLEIVGSGYGNQMLSKVYEMRNYVVEVLTNAIDTERELNIAKALIIGVKDGLTDDIKQAYSASGAMHVLAVSGLHVGIIYAIVLLVFGRLQSSNYGRWHLAFITVFLLWIYAAVTGFSPSVLRAVTMFTFVAISKASLRTTNIYNTLAASAFVLLLFNPYLIMSVGFQLSYLAVVGIVYIQPKIYHLWIPKAYIADKVWQITSVSIAAQLATFSLGLLYFHQFPTFFLLSNLVVIPGAFLVLLGGIFTIVTSFYAPLSAFIGGLLKWLIFGINEVVFWIEKLPHSIVEDIYINTLETWLIIGVMFCLLMAAQRRSAQLVYVSLALAFCFSVSKWSHIYTNAQQDSLTIYRVNNHLSIEFISKGKSEVYTDSLLFNDQDKMRFHIEPNQLRSGVFRSVLNTRKSDTPFEWLVWKDKKVLILNDRIDLESMEVFGYCNLLILSDNFSGDLALLEGIINFDLLILDGSLKYYRADALLEKAKELNYPVYSVFHDGAYQQII
ncbi:ComEC/Rec2 family competence protein [Fulvivirga lutea]|uniref:ComEC family competence protein n=1 Tax=Fulvivirga lutea TaxID=2810512 RepID=A0A974ZZT7_9BACT|nr:ComEC/Rec2 family competence protein [Fulvivirga lutea]QSE96116.1 ComEC family competence protein [Fulvivirga lutea]